MSQAHNETLESIKYTRGSLRLMDQRKLPLETIFNEIETINDIYNAIKEMQVRGAPAIAVSATLGIVVAAEKEMQKVNWKTLQEVKSFILESCERVKTARPTAVNLALTLAQFKKDVENINITKVQTAAEFIEEAVKIAEEIYAADIAFNVGIMQHGANYISRLVSMRHNTNNNNNNNNNNICVLTICNTGALATSRYGTALGIVRQLFYNNKLNQLYACETRPWNQGARLTIYECVKENIPCTLICDNAAAALMHLNKIDVVIVGADRICNNGDTANKIGTYNLAIIAAYHKIPFFVAAPSTTLDINTSDGSKVIIEEREGSEISHNLVTQQRVVAAGPFVQIWNPVFDITPAELITGGIITEYGVVEPAKEAPYYNMTTIIRSNNNNNNNNNAIVGSSK